MTICAAPWIALANAAALASASDEAESLKTDSDAPYVHRLTLYDHDGTAIDPTDDFAGPYSPKETCGKCHPYAEIHGGWHFNAMDPDVPPGRNGEPWWLIDEKTGTQIPISYRKWPGVFSPQDAGLTHWQMVKRFGHHIPGGGFGEPSDEIIANEPEAARWNISGKLEIDCMFCHSADSQHDPAEADRQIERENFKWSPTAALGLAAIRGDASKAPDDWDPMLGPDPDNPEASGPSLEWNLSRFDADDRVFFNITGRPPNTRCLFCHTSHEVGPASPPDILQPRDVHLAAGLMCVDCHRNGEDHKIVRGYEAEAIETGQPERAAYSCRGCHLGVAGASDPELALGGHYGAPHPQHKGLPPIHFEKLTCTACHSGPWPEMNAKQFQTALAHGLGLASRERDAETPPEIVGPIFGRPQDGKFVLGPQLDGKIAPRRLVWPMFWGRTGGSGDIGADYGEDIRDAIYKAADEGQPQHPGAGSMSYTDEQVAVALKQLRRDNENHPFVYVQRGFIQLVMPDLEIFKWGMGPADTPDANSPLAMSSGLLEALINEKAGPFHWPIAHGVRPASQALGVRGCTDCHTNDAAVFFGDLSPAGASPETPAIRNVVELRDEDASLVTAWANGFKFRPVFKWLTAACVILLVFLVRRAMLTASSGSIVTPERVGFTAYDHLIHIVATVGVLIQAATGPIAEWFFDGVHGWILFIHMLGAPLFVVGTTLVAWRWAHRLPLGRYTGGQAASGTRNSGARDGGVPYTIGQRWMFWICVLLAFWVTAPMLAAMLPTFGTAGQELLIEIHEIAAIAFVVAMVLHTIVSLAAKRKHSEPRA